VLSSWGATDEQVKKKKFLSLQMKTRRASSKRSLAERAEAENSSIVYKLDGDRAGLILPMRLEAVALQKGT
jgi:hypothetical protein